MGLTYATIELMNMFDEDKFDNEEILESNIRRWTGRVKVDTSVKHLIINEVIQECLGLKAEKITATSQDGSPIVIYMAGGVKVVFGNRYTSLNAFVLPANAQPIMGTIPIDCMDLVVIPSTNTLEYNPEHPDGPVFSLK